MPGGIMVAIIPARSAWDGTMVNHWCKWYEHVRVWKFPDRVSEEDESAFEDFTQICVVGRRLPSPRIPEAAQKKRLSGFRWRKPEKAGQSPWEQGLPPPELPTTALADSYQFLTSYRQGWQCYPSKNCADNPTGPITKPSSKRTFSKLDRGYLLCGNKAAILTQSLFAETIPGCHASQRSCASSVGNANWTMISLPGVAASHFHVAQDPDDVV